MMAEPPVRRFLKSRETRWANALAGVLIRARVSPNFISALSILFAAAGGGFLFLTAQQPRHAQAMFFVAAAFLIQCRLLCNLLDGMVAIGGGRQTSGGEVWNDLPDRISDALILVGAGYGIPWMWWGRELGWFAALLAVLTAYVRMLGGALGLRQSFAGPMAKQHRMAVLTAACLLSAGEAFVAGPAQGRVLAVALGVIIAGSVFTVARRTRAILGQLNAK